jgi:hypothetical protein
MNHNFSLKTSWEDIQLQDVDVDARFNVADHLQDQEMRMRLELAG